MMLVLIIASLNKDTVRKDFTKKAERLYKSDIFNFQLYFGCKTCQGQIGVDLNDAFIHIILISFVTFCRNNNHSKNKVHPLTYSMCPVKRFRYKVWNVVFHHVVSVH